MESPTQITVRNHKENARTSFYKEDDFRRCYGIYAVGMNVYGDLANHGTINIGQNDSKTVMNFSNDFDEEFKYFVADAQC